VIVLESVGLAERDVPEYVEADHNKMTATYTRVPNLSDVPYAVADGTEPGRRVLLALIQGLGSRRYKAVLRGGLFRIRGIG
jgi:hypothetical protein